ncbi:MAG: fatty acid desaturase [Actinomycetota bacterium]|nr:fatty acid desaturase [Actinomycetota bacterium]
MQSQAVAELIEENVGPPLTKIAKPRELPQELFKRRSGVFVAKFLFAYGVIAAGWVAIAMNLHLAVSAAAVVVIGLMYAHLVELQHECLHEHAFRGRQTNRIFGFLCGMFMFSSFSHYKYEHLRHHALLGRDENKEFFNYRFNRLDSPLGFVRGAWHLGRYADVMRHVARSLTGRPIEGVKRPTTNRRIKTEYRLFVALFAGAVAFTALTGDTLLLWAWLLPLLLVAEPMHFLIELPEHFGLNTQHDPSVLTNTRTVKAGPFLEWFTNGNNLHTTHHAHPGVPMENVPLLSVQILPHFEVVEDSYWTFYKKVVKGEVRYEDFSATCMTR